MEPDLKQYIKRLHVAYRSRRILEKSICPEIDLPVGVEAANFLFSLTSLFLLALFLGARASWGLLFLPLALILTLLFILGIILIAAIITVYFRDLFHILQIVFVGLFYLVPIIYKKEFFGSDLLIVLQLNPFFYFIQLFQQIIYEARIPDASLWLTCSILMIVSLTIGLLVFKLKEKDVIYRL